ncbi:putative bifunctional diguanylate cyclase/phosphodiesterase [Nocardioides sp. Kera G14]|uniref:putative bifunctional diguanylate cyclase/phosphodiesterase n=1 Tax=Nocardioides sp. Kera G14 TaxID=2884264 RepID=UPI001D10F1A2|nr:EAL domain-containing protein [Nocardioides sp. Kera G14]UDY25227.1 EAL domain-containing protein [Nocardioides sp. Kera G14]
MVQPGESLRRYYHAATFAVGLAVFAAAAAQVLTDGLGPKLWLGVFLGAPLIALIARFPMVLDRGEGGIEVGFESSILLFLVCTMPTDQALVIWSLGVMLTQALSGKLLSVRLVNIGIGIIAGALAALIVTTLPDRDVVSPRGLIVVACAAAVYFLTDYVGSGLSLFLAGQTTLGAELLQSETLWAIACFVPLDSLGYLGAVVERSAPWWTLGLLVVPLTTLLIATRAVTRGRENARRLTVLFGAAVRAQTLTDRDAVLTSLVSDARELLLLRTVELRPEAPDLGEVGVRVQLGEEVCWLTARAANRARSTTASDEQALRALAAVASDAIGRLELTTEMVHVARHDPLTDLPNRGILIDQITQALEASDRGPVTLFFLDLDGFKPINDRFGHGAGDRVLVELARRLRQCAPDGATIARVGGDEFAILCTGLPPQEAGPLCERLVAAFETGVDVAGQRVQISVSIGIAHATRDETAASLLRNADVAMYEAKTQGKGRYAVYEPSMGRSRLDRLELVDELRRAIHRREIALVYQPVVSLATGRIVGAEALARWQRNGSPVRPDIFISAAEESGLIVGLGDVVLGQAASDAAAMREAFGGSHSLSVNISAAQLRDPDFLETVERTARTMSGSRLVLEITERQGVDLDAEVLAAMRTITDMGVAFAIDDFGVGFSSISYLHDLPAQILKADAALSAGIDRDDRARTLLRSVAFMGRGLGFDVVIEGIERESQLDIIRSEMPGAFAQGYFLHRPMPLDRLLQTVRSERSGVASGD